MKGLLLPTMLPLQGLKHKEKQGIRDSRTKVPLHLGASQQALPLRNLCPPLRHDSIPCMELSFHLHPGGCHPSSLPPRQPLIQSHQLPQFLPPPPMCAALPPPPPRLLH